MNIQIQNIQMIKRHNRRIVQRAYQKSKQNYQFPIKIQYKRNSSQSSSQQSELLSLHSEQTQNYNLFEQNIKYKEKCAIIKQEQQRKIITISQLFKKKSQLFNSLVNKNDQVNQKWSLIRKIQNDSNSINSKQTHLIDNKDKKISTQRTKSQSIKRKYLSLTPNKSSLISSINKKISISCSKNPSNIYKHNKSIIQNPQINKINKNLSFLNQIKLVASDCFMKVSNSFEQNNNKQAIFYYQQKQINLFDSEQSNKMNKFNKKQTMTTKISRNSDIQTLENTPIIMDIQNPYEYSRRSAKNHQFQQISKFK